jgi:putative NIF3 family GTP cyclohydrolase 1 type 2
MFQVNDLVMVVTEHPKGAIDADVFGSYGVIVEVLYEDGKTYYTVHTRFDPKESGYIYAEDEIRLLLDEECREALVDLMRL